MYFWEFSKNKNTKRPNPEIGAYQMRKEAKEPPVKQEAGKGKGLLNPTQLVGD